MDLTKASVDEMVAELTRREELAVVVRVVATDEDPRYEVSWTDNMTQDLAHLALTRAAVALE